MAKLFILLTIAGLLSGCDERSDIFGQRSIASTSAPSAAPIRDYTLTMPGETSDRHGTIDRAGLRRLIHLTPGQSRRAMNSSTGIPGIPYAYTHNIEWRRMRHQESTWIGIEYGADGRYRSYHVSGANGGNF